VIRHRPRWRPWKTRRPAGGKRTRAALASVTIVAALALASTALADAPAASASTSAKVPSQVTAGLNELVHEYSPVTNLIGGSWWQAAVTLSTLETYQQTTGDRTYENPLIGAFTHYSGGNFENNYDDDTAWWGLVWLQAYTLTHYAPYLNTAETIAHYIHLDWTSTCGGGVWWRRSSPYDKNAIANELFLELTGWLYNTTHTGEYKTWAVDEWDWFARSKMITKSYQVRDGLPSGTYSTAACGDGSISANIYTYNQGVILAGLAQLYKATSNSAYLTEAEKIANAALNPKLSPATVTKQGVLNEPTCKIGSTKCGGDAQSFKGIFVRGLKMLNEIAPSSKNKYKASYNKFFATQARCIETKDTVRITTIPPARDFFGMFWGGPTKSGTYSTYTTASGLDALVAALGLPSQSSC
jgi:predicted alpha-1,6-mannanase (GH76 family)